MIDIERKYCRESLDAMKPMNDLPSTVSITGPLSTTTKKALDVMVANNPNFRKLDVCLSLPADAVDPDLDADTLFKDVPMGLEHITLHGNASHSAVPVVNLWRSAPTLEFELCNLQQIVSVFEDHGLMGNTWIVRIHPDTIPKRDQYREHLGTGKITDIVQPQAAAAAAAMLSREFQSLLLRCRQSVSRKREGAFTHIDRHCIYWWC